MPAKSFKISSVRRAGSTSQICTETIRMWLKGPRAEVPWSVVQPLFLPDLPVFLRWRGLPPFGPDDAKLVIVGLAPGMHGANATGRPFTGDYAGILLYSTLHSYGFASQPDGASPDDGLALVDCRITNAVRCVPPENKPTPLEITTCRDYLKATIAEMKSLRAIVALGRVAHDTTLIALDSPRPKPAFGHGCRADVGTIALFDSYHCSRYNTNTRVLTPEMFRDVFAAVRRHLS